ncbi:MAG: glycosyltransferase family 9 protein [Nanoarchaeota archaeon]
MKTLIIKLGALGDIVRTTVLLNNLDGEIYWLTKYNAKDLLTSKKITDIFFIDNPDNSIKNMVEELKNIEFDLIISLDEEKEALNFLKNLKSNKIIGVYLKNNGDIDYTTESSYWFDMSLSSKLGKEKADDLKFENPYPVPQILVEMVFGKGSWKDQEYDIGYSINTEDNRETRKKFKIGLINISETKWPNKFWGGYGDLYRTLREKGENVSFLNLKPTLKEHIEDINSCDIIVCGDSLDMHLALALKKRVVAIFNCTPPIEIYGYKRMEKLISPLLQKYFLKHTNDKEAQSAVNLEEVYASVNKILKD